MPNGFPRGLDINPATNILAQSFLQQGQQNDAQSAFKNFLDKSQMIPTQNLPPVGNGQSVPTSPTDPGMLQALSQLLVNPYGKELYGAYQGQQPKYQEIPAGTTYGSTQGGQFTKQGETASNRAPLFGWDSNNAPTMMNQSTGQTAPSPITTPAMRNSQLAGQKAETAKSQGQQRIDVSNTSVSAPQLDENGQMGVTITDKRTGQSRFEPVGVKGQQKSGSLSGSTKTMLETAPNVKYFVNKTLNEIAQMENGLGAGASRWREFKAGKVGLADPSFTELRTNMGLLTTLLMRMHVGARGGEYIMKHFQELLGSGKQSPENLTAALNQIGQYADQLMSEHSTGTQTKQQQSKFKILEVH